MNEPGQGLFATLLDAVEDSAALVSRMPGLVVLTVAASGAIRALNDLVEAHFGADTPMTMLWTALPALAATCAVATPISLALSRHIVLWEPLTWASLRRRARLLPDVFVAIWLVATIMLAPMAIVMMFFPSEFSEDELAPALIALPALVGALLWIGVSLVRFLLLEAMVAVEERDARLRTAWRSTAGQAWRISVLVLPIVAGFIAIEVWIMPDKGTAAPQKLTHAILFGVLDTVSTAVLTALAARIYLWRSRPE